MFNCKISASWQYLLFKILLLEKCIAKWQHLHASNGISCVSMNSPVYTECMHVRYIGVCARACLFVRRDLLRRFYRILWRCNFLYNLWTIVICFWLVELSNYWPSTELREGNVFSRVCLSVQEGGKSLPVQSPGPSPSFLYRAPAAPYTAYPRYV